MTRSWTAQELATAVLALVARDRVQACSQGAWVVPEALRVRQGQPPRWCPTVAHHLDTALETGLIKIGSAAGGVAQLTDTGRITLSHYLHRTLEMMPV